MLSRLRRWFDRTAPSSVPGARFDADPDLGWFFPPEDPNDAVAWNRYWSDQLSHGLGPSIFDMFCDDRALIRVMWARGFRRVLCAGSGISQEPRALAEAGLDVVALDFSERAIEIAASFEFSEEAFVSYCDPDARRPGGRVKFVRGDILDPAVCPGPFDVIIERRTVQLFVSQNDGAVLSALARRLAPEGILVSQSHDPAWRPPEPPRHFAERWFRRQGWTVWHEGDGEVPAGRLAWLQTTTG